MKKTEFHWRRIAAFVLSILFCFLSLFETEHSCAAAAPAAACLSLGSRSAKERTLIPVGRAIGIKLFAEGVLVVGLAEQWEPDKVPAADAGLKAGDFILSMNGQEIQSTEHFQTLLQKNGKKAAELTVRRGDKTRTLTVKPVLTAEEYRIGAYIRDSMAGIGTMTYYDPVSGCFAALGHSINDVDTGLLMPLEHGSVMPASVKAVLRGECGAPGQLKGDFDMTKDLGELYDNNECGVYGTLDAADYVCGKPLKAAKACEVHEGPATILADIAGSEVKEYSIEITKLYPLSGSTRNMLVTVTDEELLSVTGGIVQGMSGCPILQDGKLAGAVTHVLMDDPTKGYAILIDNMLLAAESGRVAA